jgi:hypothetical protein
MSSAGAAPCAVPAIHARAEASRRNGAKSRGPKTTEGKARSSQNALKHGFRAQKHVVLDDEDAAEFAALEAALVEELAPDGAPRRPGGWPAPTGSRASCSAASAVAMATSRAG